MPNSAVYNPESDVMTMDASVEDKIIMYSATLYEYTKKYADRTRLVPYGVL